LKVQNLLIQDMIIPDLAADNGEDALKAMVVFLREKNIIQNPQDIYDRLIQREKLGSTAVSDGFAIPHCKIKGIKHPLLLLAVSKKGVEFNSPLSKPVHIFFMVLSSPENPSINLQVLAAIAHLIRKSKHLKKKIMAAESSVAIFDIVRAEEDRVNEQG
jgi:mannitol/fructose-specific phosphotransferase system IIA component (Ntr-type)